jgi:hypothetical protein
MSSSHLLRLITIVFGLSVSTAGAGTISLYYSFDLPPAGSLQTVTIPLAAGGWHEGTDTGPLVTEAEFDSDIQFVVGLEIGGIGQDVTVPGCCVQAYAFYLVGPDMAGVVSDDFTSGTGGWYVFPDIVYGGPPASLGVIGYDFTPTLIGFVAPPKYNGDYSGQVGQALTFGLEPFESTLGVGGLYDGGLVILTIAPEPSTSCLLFVGVICVGIFLSNRGVFGNRG